MQTEVLFALGCCFMLVHEMDAIRFREWVVLPLLKGLPELTAARTFVLLHLPIYAAVYFFLSAAPVATRLVLNLFFIVHLGLHVVISRVNPKYPFTEAQSWIWIGGAGLFGLLAMIG